MEEESRESLDIINSSAEFEAPLEFTKMPLPAMEINKEVDFEFMASGSGKNSSWNISKGELPEGLRFNNGRSAEALQHRSGTIR